MINDVKSQGSRKLWGLVHNIGIFLNLNVLYELKLQVITGKFKPHLTKLTVIKS